MLRSFTVANHKSIKDEQELMLLPAYDKKRSVVPVAAIFGANASGKSNLLDSIAWLRTAVLDSYGRWQPGSGVPRTRFALSPDTEEQPTSFAVDLLVEGVRHVYELAVDSRAVREEQLTSYPSGRPRVIFRRNGNTIMFGSTVAEAKSRTAVLSKLTRDNALFLSVAAINDVDEVQPVYQWFRTGCVIGGLDEPEASWFEEDLAERLAEDDNKILVELIKAADLGINDIQVSSSPYSSMEDMFKRLLQVGVITTAGETVINGYTIPYAIRDPDAAAEVLKAAEANRPARVMFYHGNGGGVLGLGDQSAGTRSWINLLCDALGTLDRGGVLLIDEVDASLHPHLTSQLINLFRDDETNPNTAQLVFTTHDATLLDEGVLARDEIWFMEKDAESGSSQLYPLTDFHPRKNENTLGRYLAGSYGAVPVLANYRFRSALRQGRDSDAA